MAAKDGDGWAQCERGHRHWGVHGASGLLAVHHDSTGKPRVLMQRRSPQSHHGDTWGLPGGALDSHEDAVVSAFREAREEADLDGEGLRVQSLYVDDHGGWSFHTVIAEASRLLEAAPANSESTDLRWLTLDEISGKNLHPGFAETWPVIQRTLAPRLVVLDAANIIGARAEHGWWKDRAGAAAKLISEVGALSTEGLRTPPGDLSALDRWFPRFVAVIEGAARNVAAVPGISVIAAPGSGDDAIVRAVQDAAPWEHVLVVTADRGLRERVTALGADVTGPRWLLSQL